MSIENVRTTADEQPNDSARYQEAISRSYEGLAFDLDNTAADENGKLTAEGLQYLSYNLRCGNPQIVATGRSAKYVDAFILDSLLQTETIPCDRLFTATGNGTQVRVFQKRPDGTFAPQLLHEEEFALGKTILGLLTDNDAPWAEQFVVDAATSPWQTRLTSGGSRGYASKFGRCATRLVMSSPATAPSIDEMKAYLAQSGITPDMYEVTSDYIKYEFNAPAANKGRSIELIAKYLGIEPEAIARVGDSGGLNGNDWSMLQSSSGFTVDHRDTTNPAFCIPVIGKDGQRQYRFAGFTTLISDLRYVSRFITTPSVFSDAHLRKLERAGNRARSRFLHLSQSFEEAAERTNTVVDSQTLEQLRGSSEGKVRGMFSSVGAIMLSRDEIEAVSRGPLYDFLHAQFDSGGGLAYRVVYGNEGISFARGRAFYAADKLFTENLPLGEQYQTILDVYDDLLSRRTDIVQHLKDNAIQIPEWKVALSYYDHLKQAALQAFHAFSYLVTKNFIEPTPKQGESVKRCLRADVQSAIGDYFDLLSLRQPTGIYREANSSLQYARETTMAALQDVSSDQQKIASKAIRCMDQNHPYHNLIYAMATAEMIATRCPPGLTLVGQHFGGAELPFIVAHILRTTSPQYTPAFLAAHYSRYGMRGHNPKNNLDVSTILDGPVPAPGSHAVLCDDGVFSGKTTYRVGAALSVKGVRVQFAPASIGIRDVGHMMESGVVTEDFYRREFEPTVIRVAPDVRTTSLASLQKARQTTTSIVRRRIQNLFRP